MEHNTLLGLNRPLSNHVWCGMWTFKMMIYVYISVCLCVFICSCLIYVCIIIIILISILHASMCWIAWWELASWRVAPGPSHLFWYSFYSWVPFLKLIILWSVADTFHVVPTLVFAFIWYQHGHFLYGTSACEVAEWLTRQGCLSWDRMKNWKKWEIGICLKSRE